ncbi:XamI family restriction endonuclease [Roseateles depolymerans]|uniref:Type II site-specific deoxyribonuclease n=1 Tax=Roseateles depolymerans TaxID=76731 RepID=A0A0U3N7K1_9BURK|nr:XamI family restriction endonuclease [Roseateles depolymerans]ALV04544.1 Type II site-specific deoxyribonuclease [Roseateles depolymerans]REG14076.1 XamI restriction endonuclease [Roseateles depolymerans]
MAQPSITARALPERASLEQIQDDCRQARAEFRSRRLLDPLKDYNGVYPEAVDAAAFVIDALGCLLVGPGVQRGASASASASAGAGASAGAVSGVTMDLFDDLPADAPVPSDEPAGADAELLASIVSHKLQFQALRALAAPPISEDDLDTLLDARVNKTAVRRNSALADEIGRLLLAALDPHRFPWVLQGRPPTEVERYTAIMATAVLISMNTVYTRRRSDERDQLEGRLEQLLVDKGYTRAPAPRGGIADVGMLPPRGVFMRQCKLGKHNADLVVMLWDGRLLAVECKASNSTVNGEKRLNKEVVADAGDWYDQFGRSNLVAAALRGVFKPAKVREAQEQGVYLFWWHRIDALADFLDRAR